MCLRQDVVEGGVEAAPLDEEQRQHALALDRQPVEPLVAFALFPPLADEQPLGFQPAQQRVKRAFVDHEAVFREDFAQRVAVLFRAKCREHGDGEAPPPKLQPEVVEQGRVEWASATVCHILSDKHCMTHR